MKRVFYIASFTFLGILIQLLAHALIEVWYLGLLLKDFPRYGFGMTWETWVLIHNVLTVLFFAAGLWIGYKEGVYWWRKIYEENLIAVWRKKFYGVEWKSGLFPVFVAVISVVTVNLYLHYFYPLTTIEQPEKLFDVPKNYVNNQFGFELKYPMRAVAIEGDFGGLLPATQLGIVGIFLDKAQFRGTNLVEAGVFVGVSAKEEVLARCEKTANQETDAGYYKLSGMDFKVLNGVGAAAGNLYELRTYRKIINGRCYEVSEVMHSGNIGNYPEGSVVEFDKQKIAEILAQISHTLKLKITNN